MEGGFGLKGGQISLEAPSNPHVSIRSLEGGSEAAKEGACLAGQLKERYPGKIRI